MLDIRISDTEHGKDLALECFHVFGIVIVLVIIAEQMQGAVNGQVGVVVA